MQVFREGSCWIEPPGIRHTVRGWSEDCEVWRSSCPPSTRPRRTGSSARSFRRRLVTKVGLVAYSRRFGGASAMRSGRQIVIDARPEALTVDPAQSAVIVVDMQNDFGAKGGMFALAGIDISAIRSVICGPTSRVLAAARLAGVAAVDSKWVSRPDLSDAGGTDGPNRVKHRRLRLGEATAAPDGTPSRILIRDTWNTDIVPELAPEPDDIVLYKQPIQRLLRNRSRRYPQDALHQEPDLHRMHHKRVRRVHRTGCDVPGLHLSPTGLLHGRAGAGRHQPRGLPARHTGTIRLGFAVHAVRRCAGRAIRAVSRLIGAGLNVTGRTVWPDR